MFRHDELTGLQLKRLIHSNKVSQAGNRKLKIYGLLSCTFGKRMNKENRVFFSSEKEAIEKGYRPCGHCLRVKYKVWIGK